jgi:hypothetical protein
MKMRLGTILLLLVPCVMPGVRVSATATGRDGSRFTKQVDEKPKLQLTTDITERKTFLQYVGFTLRLTFKNVGSTPIILGKEIFLVRLLSSRDLEAAAAGQYESAATFDYMGAIPPRDEPSGMSNFVTLKPGEEYTYDTGVGSFTVHNGEGKPLKGELGRGEHYLQVEVNTWSYLNDPAPLRRKWRKQGFLWSETLTSQPMLFTL